MYENYRCSKEKVEFWERKKGMFAMKNVHHHLCPPLSNTHTDINDDDHTNIRPYKVCLYEGIQAGVYRLKRKNQKNLIKRDLGNHDVYHYVEKLKGVMKNLEKKLPKMGDVGVDEEEATRVKQKFEKSQNTS